MLKSYDSIYTVAVDLFFHRQEYGVITFIEHYFEEKLSRTKQLKSDVALRRFALILF